MESGDIVSCSCGCGGTLRAHHVHGTWARYLNGHNHHESLDRTGERYGRLEVLECFARKRWLCVCACGSLTIVYDSNLTTDKTKSCGCLRNEKSSVRMRELGSQYGGSKLRFDTVHERLMKRSLSLWNIRFKHNTKVFSRGRSKKGYYLVDFYLPAYRIALEVDGGSHNRHRERDSIRDAHLLRTHGVQTIRVGNKEVAKLTKDRLLKRIFGDA